MAQPILVRAYKAKPTPTGSPSGRSHALPPISAFSFESILRAADGPDVQAAIEGIAEICAKNRMSLAEEYASHMPPVGEIMGGNASAVDGMGDVGLGVGLTVPVKPAKPAKPVVRRALTSVPEGSSSGSEGSRRSRRRSIFGLIAGGRKDVKAGNVRVIRIGSMGRTVSAGCTTALTCTIDGPPPVARNIGDDVMRPRTRAVSAASTSLQRLLEARSRPVG